MRSSLSVSIGPRGSTEVPQCPREFARWPTGTQEEIIMSVYTVWKSHKEINALLLNTWIESDTWFINTYTGFGCPEMLFLRIYVWLRKDWRLLDWMTWRRKRTGLTSRHGDESEEEGRESGAWWERLWGGEGAGELELVMRGHYDEMTWSWTNDSKARSPADGWKFFWRNWEGRGQGANHTDLQCCANFAVQQSDLLIHIGTFFFSNYLPSCSIPRDWI